MFYSFQKISMSFLVPHNNSVNEEGRLWSINEAKVKLCFGFFAEVPLLPSHKLSECGIYLIPNVHFKRGGNVMD